MPRYCAVKVCKNRGGTLPKQQHRRISFYPFPLQDISRLQKWVGNMRRERWTPSRHQYLCSAHFTEDCFDIRWGIRYLKATAVPTIFPSIQDDSELKKCNHSQQSLNNEIRTDPTDVGLSGSASQPSKRPLILTRTAATRTSPTTTTTGQTESVQACWDYTSENLTPNTQGASCSASSGGGVGRQDEVDSTATVWYRGSRSGDTAVGAATEPREFSLVPTETITPGIRGDAGGRASLDDDHSYCRGAATDRQQLWARLLSLHAKVLGLDHREEKTVARIHALESEIVCLKRAGVVFKEKQKVLEDYICSVLV